jgi:hypothetical protein
MPIAFADGGINKNVAPGLRAVKQKATNKTSNKIPLLTHICYDTPQGRVVNMELLSTYCQPNLNFIVN